jgi:hypothetical protein
MPYYLSGTRSFSAGGGVELPVLSVTSPAKPMLIPGIRMYAIFVFFLLRPKASAFFTKSANV